MALASSLLNLRQFGMMFNIQLIGVAWVSYVAGSAATLLSQWPVENAELMTSFHQEFKMHTPNALQQATIKLLNSPAFRHPVHWAGFTFLSGIK